MAKKKEEAAAPAPAEKSVVVKPKDEMEIVLLPPGSGRRIVTAEKAEKLQNEKKCLIVGKPKPSSKASRD